MAGGSSFEQWQKDVFFSAAEEVQESADAMESIYRMWIRNRRDGFDLEDSDVLRRELQAALGIAKWQLEEFEKAVKLSHKKYSLEENAIFRHKQFVSALRNQNLHVEKDLNDSLIEEGKQPLCWIRLDKEEQDDLASFLSCVPCDGQQAKHVDHNSYDPMSSSKDTIMINKDKRYVVEVAENEPDERKDDVVLANIEHSHEQTRVLSSLDIGDWKIVIADEDTDKGPIKVRPDIPSKEFSKSGILRSLESTSNRKQFWSNLWKAKNEDQPHLSHGLSYYLDLKGVTRFVQGINGLAERSRTYFSNTSQGSKLSHSQHLVGKVGGFQRRMEGSHQHMHFIRYLWITFLLVLSVVLVGKLTPGLLEFLSIL
ncbi:hypothetical protein Cni_G22252 [Canna indica]|uniref:Syntaxin 6/10/61 N-terminal domain-containing protein n=1 Tax=Canna indica TaxID=4628 RepID=A0AAQ3KR04_9LILI|nr:hypothetical protein Cni_G22252 [Canna indica]